MEAVAMFADGQYGDREGVTDRRPVGPAVAASLAAGQGRVRSRGPASRPKLSDALFAVLEESTACTDGTARLTLGCPRRLLLPRRAPHLCLTDLGLLLLSGVGSIAARVANRLQEQPRVSAAEAEEHGLGLHDGE
ncbi:hypothetical protein [Streptomyces sp. NPDC060333]|uniref:hypothetical protein n=1 Tax=Streptomyces sp. NPDC060333 TaxID=3347098 RepID=UPI00364FF9F4